VSRFFLHLSFALILAACIFPFCFAQSSGTSTVMSAEPASLAGKWEMSWTGRLGTQKCALELQQDSTKLKGTLRDQRGDSALSGTVEGNKISFDVDFKGPKPFTTRFTGSIDGDKITGTSQAIGVGGAGAYLGHAGEIVQPEHPWTATRATNPPGSSGESKPANSPGRN
jgi:hypothetical protein